MWVYAWSGFCMDRAEDSFSRFFPTMIMKTKSLGRSSKGLFRTHSDRISHHILIFRTICWQLLARAEIFYLLFEVVYLPSRFKFVYPAINLVFLGIIVKVKLPVKFCLRSCELFCLQISSDEKYFSLLVQDIVIEG